MQVFEGHLKYQENSQVFKWVQFARNGFLERFQVER